MARDILYIVFARIYYEVQVFDQALVMINGGLSKFENPSGHDGIYSSIAWQQGLLSYHIINVR